MKMNFKQRLNSALLALLPNNAVFAEYYRRGSSKKPEWTRQANTLQSKEIKDWKNGVMAATDPENPRRGDLMRFYQNLLLDNHLSGVIDTRILRVQRSPFKLVDDKGNENSDLKQLLERPWFEDLARLVLLSRFQGATLIELFDTDAETAELERVSEIPQSSFIPQKGLIVKEEYDDTGTDYRGGAYADYYLQVGGDWDLGMLNQLAMIVLAKKLGLGSWMSYVDKYGVPPIFAITDRMDTARRDELFEMMSSFRQNMFAVLQGNEKIEVPRITETNPHQVFLSLINDVCNREISKRVLGGTSTTDEKSFVGSAEVQERVAQDRHEADRLLFKYVFNSKIRRRLVKISPLYRDFEKYRLEWDDQETLNITGYIDAVQKLSTAFVFDVEEIRNRTGLPVTGIRQPAGPFPPAPEPDRPKPANTQKKKTEQGTAARIDYRVFAATRDAAINQLTEQAWNGTARASGLSRDLVMKYYAALNQSAQSGWGKGYFDEDLTRRFRENLLKFSGAKAHDIIAKMIAERAAHSNREAYDRAVKGLSGLYSETYLAVESKFAANSASSARDFSQYVKDTDLYPCLKNRTMGDGNVRETHAVNEGVVKPVSEWTQIPPYDPGCRCWLEQTREKPTANGLENIDDRWANNPAVNGELFLEKKHSYFDRIEKQDRLTVRDNTERMKEFMPYNREIKAGANTVFVNDFADLKDLKDNIENAKVAAEALKKDMWIRPHVDNVRGYSNPEYGIGRKNILADLKTMEEGSGNFFQSRIKSANKQGCKCVVMNIDNYSGDAKQLSGKIRDAFVFKYDDGWKATNRNVKKIIIIRNKKVIQLTRKQIEKNMFGDLDKLN